LNGGRLTLALTAALGLPLVAAAQPAEDPGAEPGAAERLGPVELEAERATVGLGLGAQLRATLRGAGTERSSQFELHRARPMLRVAFRQGQVRFRLHLDLAPRAFELLDVWVEGDLAHDLTLRAGISKIPFSLYWDQGFMELSLIDWPLTTRWFGGGRQLGLTLASQPQTGWQWALGLYQGQTLRAANGQRFTTAYGEARTNYLDLQTHTALAAPHPELVGRVAHRSARPGLESAVALSVAWDLRPTRAVDESLRVGFDGRVAAGPFTTWAGAYLALSEAGDGDLMVSYGGSLLEVELRPHPSFGIIARHSAIVRSDALRADARRWAEECITNGDPAERDALEARYAEVDRIRAEHETTLGLKVALARDDLTLQIDGSWLRTAGLADDGWRVRAQLGIGF